MIELMSQKEQILIKLVDRLSVLFVNTGTFQCNFRFYSILCNRCHDVAQKYSSFNDVAVVTIRENYYCR